jgi:hypothetical protein
MADINFVRREIEYMRIQVGRQRNDILQLRRAGIATASAELLLRRMVAKVESLCAARDKFRQTLPDRSPRSCSEARVVKRYFSGTEDRPPFLKALAEVRKIGVHEGWCYHHVQAVILARSVCRDGDRQPGVFWNRPQSIGGGQTRGDHGP